MCLEEIVIKKTDYKDGACVLYLGKAYILEIRKYLSYKKPGIQLEGNKLVVLTAVTDSAIIKEALFKWYFSQAKLIIPQRVSFYQNLIQEHVEGIRIKDVKSRWGSCSSKRNLNFNWRLILAPPEVMDYVVVHELCHLKEMNHSKAFWKLVEGILPDYKKQRDWLKKCGLIESY